MVYFGDQLRFAYDIWNFFPKWINALESLNYPVTDFLASILTRFLELSGNLREFIRNHTPEAVVEFLANFFGVYKSTVNIAWPFIVLFLFFKSNSLPSLFRLGRGSLSFIRDLSLRNVIFSVPHFMRKTPFFNRLSSVAYERWRGGLLSFVRYGNIQRFMSPALNIPFNELPLRIQRSLRFLSNFSNAPLVNFEQNKVI